MVKGDTRFNMFYSDFVNCSYLVIWKLFLPLIFEESVLSLYSMKLRQSTATNDLLVTLSLDILNIMGESDCMMVNYRMHSSIL